MTRVQFERMKKQESEIEDLKKEVAHWKDLAYSRKLRAEKAEERISIEWEKENEMKPIDD